ncbi:MAG: hypothetical protein IPI01_20705 [Ignavibacteriae bacterium]|nr:hypothetical protein [Ignavibacteriota bacterium]
MGRMTSEYQMQGIQVQQDATNYLRFDLVRDAAGTRFFAASFTNNVPTIRADVSVTVGAGVPAGEACGFAVTGSYSTNGTTRDAGGGIRAGVDDERDRTVRGECRRYPPAFTALVDYFLQHRSPISPEDPTA